MTPPLLADAVEVDPFSGVGIPTLWIVCIIAFFVFALAALYLSFLRRAAYDDRTAWNYGVAMVLSAVLSGAALVVVQQTRSPRNPARLTGYFFRSGHNECFLP